FLSPSVAQFLVQRHQRVSLLKEQKKGLALLTPTERRILCLVAENKTNKEIARELFISHRTVETHRSHICEKLYLSGNRALLAFAFEHKSQLRDSSRPNRTNGAAVNQEPRASPQGAALGQVHKKVTRPKWGARNAGKLVGTPTRLNSIIAPSRCL